MSKVFSPVETKNVSPRVSHNNKELIFQYEEKLKEYKK